MKPHYWFSSCFSGCYSSDSFACFSKYKCCPSSVFCTLFSGYLWTPGTLLLSYMFTFRQKILSGSRSSNKCIWHFLLYISFLIQPVQKIASHIPCLPLQMTPQFTLLVKPNIQQSSLVLPSPFIQSPYSVSKSLCLIPTHLITPVHCSFAVSPIYDGPLTLDIYSCPSPILVTRVILFKNINLIYPIHT